MDYRTVKRCLVVAVLVLAMGVWANVTYGAKGGKPTTKRDRASKMVASKMVASKMVAAKAIVRYFEGLPGYQPGGIITRSEVKPIFQRLAKMGHRVAAPNAKKILEQVLADDAFLVRELRTPKGRKFMARIADYPLAYDRLDRLARLPRGRRIAGDLIHGPGGYKMIEYLTTARGGAELGKMLSKSPKGARFNKPTGRIYTVDMLLSRLRLRLAADGTSAIVPDGLGRRTVGR